MKAPRRKSSALGDKRPTKPAPRRKSPALGDKRPTKPAPHRKKKAVAGRPRTSKKIYRIVCADQPPASGERGKPLRRFFQIETLARAIELALEREDPLLKRVWSAVKDAGAPPMLRLELLRENGYKLCYRLTATAGAGKRAAVTLVAAKNAQECAKAAESEYVLLKKLAARAPKLVIAPFEAGALFLPDRYRRKAHHRELFFYLAEDLPGFHTVGDTKTHQFVLRGTKQHTLSLGETEQVKARLVELAARSLDGRERNAVGFTKLTAGDLLVRRGGGAARLKLSGCRWMMLRATPARVIDALQDVSWNWGMGPFHPVPRDPDAFIAALEKALGKTTTREWVNDYVRRVHAGSYPSRNPAHFAALEAYVT